MTDIRHNKKADRAWTSLIEEAFRRLEGVSGLRFWWWHCAADCFGDDTFYLRFEVIDPTGKEFRIGVAFKPRILSTEPYVLDASAGIGQDFDANDLAMLRIAYVILQACKLRGGYRDQPDNDFAKVMYKCETPTKIRGII